MFYALRCEGFLPREQASEGGGWIVARCEGVIWSQEQ